MRMPKHVQTKDTVTAVKTTTRPRLSVSVMEYGGGITAIIMMTASLDA